LVSNYVEKLIKLSYNSNTKQNALCELEWGTIPCV
jgi:hypothetical protein